MLPVINRLKDKKIIGHLFKNGYNIYGKMIFLRYQKSKSNGLPSKIAVVVGTKTAPLATDRNRIKRLIRSILYGFLGEIPPDLNIVLGINNRNFRLQLLKNADFRVILAKDIETTLQRIKS